MSARLMRGAVSLVAGTALASVAVSAWAQTAPPVIIPSPGTIAIKRIVVSATRTRQSSFDVPVSIYAVTGQQVSTANEQENLSESLDRVPGIDVQNQQNYATGVRITSRGFGAQTAFGTRNVKILIDGVPATQPDGTGDSEVIDLGDVSRIEVLSGPFSVLYGNAAGGVIQVFSKDGPAVPTVSGGILASSYGSWRASASYGGTQKFGTDGSFNYMMNASDFYSGGYRDHSAARRQQFYGKYRVQVDADTSYTLLVDALNEPRSLDPGGLTAAQYHADPQAAGNNVVKFDSRKSLRHFQFGFIMRHRIDADNSIRLLVYDVNHDVLQYLPFTGSFAASGGGVVDLARKSGGVGARFTHKDQIAGVPITAVAGVDFGYEDQHRKGYVNNYGTVGALRRNEQDIARNIAEYAQINANLTPKIIFDAGLRHSQDYFSVQDLYVTPKLTNDTGSVSYSHTSLVAGVTYHLTSTTNLFADYGEGFETPTLDQLAYLPNGEAGFNAALVPTTSENYEAGIKSLLGSRTYLQIAAFHTHTNNQIVVSSSNNGRTAYANEGQTGRNGVDASIDSFLPHHIELYGSYTLLKAFFEHSAIAGKALPGVPQQRIFTEASWHDPASGFYTSVDGRWQSRMYVDNKNSAYAAGYFTAGIAGGFRQTIGKFGFDEFARVDNLFNRTYVGAVVVAANNGQYYEPSPGRNFVLGATAKYRF
ncbi:MAG: ligand-gated channel protein [Acidiphilium sp. 37-64-53]|uniref:TonB-dependent receptor family protein n=2 Tax=Acidocellaceae TaxID=3385905 RepID=UPI000BD03D83|nr:TonB-dependent receptor [Acidiphilium sp. 37-64-53]OYW02134.1 MAG: ligand-gated channel protein [Acidiphilium sp. 37-64-53]OZB25182.1 MAG: ligand-gated channel protein [Acidiphilium sp. 34-64-41]